MKFSVFLVVAFVGIIILFSFLLNLDPTEVFKTYFTGAFGQKRSLFFILEDFTPLIFIGLGLAFAFQAGFLNIGAEGQLYIGAVLAFLCSLYFGHLHPLFVLPIVLVAGFLGGALFGLIPVGLKVKWNVDELLSTLLLVFLIYALMNFLFYGPLRSPEMVHPRSAVIPANSEIPYLIGKLDLGMVLPFIFIPFFYLLLFKSPFGYEIRTVGKNPKFARQTGISVPKVYIKAMIISGGMAGLAGVYLVNGVMHFMRMGISSNYGFIAILLAFAGEKNPIFIGLITFIYAVLITGGNSLVFQLGLTSNLSALLALILIFVFFIIWRITIRR